MTDADALLAAVIAAPDDDLPRLVYADYSEETGNAPRAEFIRTQIELAKLPRRDPRRVPLETRERELLREHQPRWQVPGLKGAQTFVRGFVEEVWAAAEVVVAQAKALEQVPIKTLRVTAIDAHIAGLAKLPFAGRLHTLNLTNNTGAHRYFERLFGLGQYRNLKSLVLRNIRCWADNVEHWNRLSYFPKISSINLSGNPIGDEGLGFIANGPAFRQIRKLYCNSDEQDIEYRIRVQGYEQLVQSPIFSQLHTLSLAGHELRNNALTPLFDFDELPKLVHLNLAENDIGSDGEDEYFDLAESTLFESLKRLNLSGNSFGVLTAHAFANSTWMNQLEYCDLTKCDTVPAARTILMESPHADVFLLDEPDAIV